MSQSKKTKHGKIFEEKTLFLRIEIGTAKDENSGIEYELSQGTAGNILIHSSKTGQYFAFDWKTLIDLAVENGLNTPFEKIEEENDGEKD